MTAIADLQAQLDALGVAIYRGWQIRRVVRTVRYEHGKPVPESFTHEVARGADRFYASDLKDLVGYLDRKARDEASR